MDIFKAQKVAAVLSVFLSLAALTSAEEDMVNKGAVQKEMKLATFAGGCFWCMEKPYEQYEGIHSVISGFSGGQEENPSYEEVSSGGTGHREAVQVTFDPARITYDELLEIG